jgi:hypothetical protein
MKRHGFADILLEIPDDDDKPDWHVVIEIKDRKSVV